MDVAVQPDSLRPIATSGCLVAGRGDAAGRGRGRAVLAGARVLAAIVFGLINAWVLLVEILR